MKRFFSIVVLLTQILDGSFLIVPDEVPSLLSVIYSNIPVIKKGTDSRLGWGFRLGNRADFQVLVELGPQTYTQPLANQGDTANSKRNTLNSLSNELFAERQRDKQIANTQGGKWLEQWSDNMNKSEDENKEVAEEPRPGIAVGEIDAKSVIPDDATLELEKLYKIKRLEAITRKIKEMKSERDKVRSSTEEALDDVSLD